MNEQSERLARAKELLSTVKHAAMATVNKDGSPHNTPLLFLHNTSLTKIYWGSHPESQHSKNILRTGQLYMVVYDAFEKGGLYIRAEAGHITSGIELDEALKASNTFQAKYNKPAIEKAYYEGGSPQKMWAATITKLWVNGVERNSQGKLTRDYRQEIAAEELKG